MKKHYFLAFDLGAESGRAMLGELDDHTISISEIYRFPNAYVNIRGRFYWDIFKLYSEILHGLSEAIKIQPKVESIAIDTWGVDFGLLAQDGTIISMPFAYRDKQTDGVVSKFEKDVLSLEELYKCTGNQIIQINTLFQLYAMKLSGSLTLANANHLLFIPDLINYFLTGIKQTEYTIASTSQLLNCTKRGWETLLFEKINISVSLMQQIVEPGTKIGQINVSHEFDHLQVISVASHDTASAIAAIPDTEKDWAYLSSGTWSLLGIESDKPIITQKSAVLNFTNEGGVENTYRILKNLTGLWILQECKKQWDKIHIYSYSELLQMATDIKANNSFIDTEAPCFLNSENMPEAINQYLEETNQTLPDSIGAYVMCIMQSLAMKYKQVFLQLLDLSPKPINKLYVLGGGSKNELLCQLTANAINRLVITGPSEATALGNIMFQAKALGYAKSLERVRTIIKNSFQSKKYLPDATGTVDITKKYLYYLKITNQETESKRAIEI